MGEESGIGVSGKGGKLTGGPGDRETRTKGRLGDLETGRLEGSIIRQT
jgi:hypothetical protein